MFRDRRAAGRALAESLLRYKGREDALVAAIPRGGVVIGDAVARALALPLDVILTKKIGHPASPEYAIGAVDLAGESIDREAVARDAIPEAYLRSEVSRIRAVLRRRYARYRGGEPPIPLKGATVILTDDGAATGFTMAAAIHAARESGARWIVAALPVAAPGAAAALEGSADELACLLRPDGFTALGRYYEDFSQVEDEEAARILRTRGTPPARDRRLPGPRR